MVYLKKIRKQFLLYKYKLFLQNFNLFFIFNNSSNLLQKFNRSKVNIKTLHVKNTLIKQCFLFNNCCQNYFLGNITFLGLDYTNQNLLELLDDLEDLIKQNSLLFLGSFIKISLKSTIKNKKYIWFFFKPIYEKQVFQYFYFLSFKFNLLFSYFYNFWLVILINLVNNILFALLQIQFFKIKE